MTAILSVYYRHILVLIVNVQVLLIAVSHTAV